MKRVILKLSGEVLAADKGSGIDEDFLSKLAGTIGKLTELGIQTGIVIGAGNFWRGRSSERLSSATADHMGMIATIINSLGLTDCLARLGYKVKLFSAVAVESIAERYSVIKAAKALDEGYIVVLAAGTGNPFFSTDSGAALRACELEADHILLAKKVDGVYNKDPNKYSDAFKYDLISFDDAISNKLGVMDTTAMVLCRDNNIPIYVFGLRDLENILLVAQGEKIGTLVK